VARPVLYERWQRLPSVTTILDIIAKPALGPWFAMEECRCFEIPMLDVLACRGHGPGVELTRFRGHYFRMRGGVHDPPEFRQRIIELVRKGRSPESLAEQLEASARTIRNWLAQAGAYVSAALIHEAVPEGPWAAVARFLTQYPRGSRGGALHLALQSLRARVEPDLVKAVSRGRRAYARSGRHARRADLHPDVGSE
jgi:transposase-like protein